MKQLLLLLFPLCSGFATLAQDTLWVKQKDDRPYLVHKVQSGENLFLLSRKYSVPPAALADLNAVSYQEGLPAGSKFRIPVGQYNFIRVESVVKSRPIFFKAGDEDDLRSISRMFNVSQSTIQRWNRKNTPDVETGDVLQVGWIAYDASQAPFSGEHTEKSPTPVAKNDKGTAAPQPPPVAKTTTPVAAPSEDTTTEAEPSAFELLYEQQTTGMSVSEESGAAVFYPLRTKAAGDVYYAFHNKALKGTILKITNPASGKTIYAKVIGPVPNLKEYYNAIVGLSNNAVAALGARDKRMFCKLKYR